MRACSAPGELRCNTDVRQDFDLRYASAISDGHQRLNCLFDSWGARHDDAPVMDVQISRWLTSCLSLCTSCTTPTKARRTCVLFFLRNSKAVPLPLTVSFSSVVAQVYVREQPEDPSGRYGFRLARRVDEKLGSIFRVLSYVMRKAISNDGDGCRKKVRTFRGGSSTIYDLRSTIYNPRTAPVFTFRKNRGRKEQLLRRLGTRTTTTRRAACRTRTRPHWPMNEDLILPLFRPCRTEFRSMEMQATDAENAAFVVFVVLLTRVTLAFDLNLYIPLSKVDENMKRAHARDGVHQKKVTNHFSVSLLFWYEDVGVPPCYSERVLPTVTP